MNRFFIHVLVVQKGREHCPLYVPALSGPMIQRGELYKTKKLQKKKIEYAMSDKGSANFTVNAIDEPNECSIKDRINSLIKEFFEESVADKKCQEQIFSWRSQDTKLSVSNWSKEKTCDALHRKIQFLKQVILKYTQTDQIQKQKIGNLQVERSQEEQKDWDNVQFVIAKYDTNFSHGQIEYSIENLTRDIRNYDEEYSLLCKKIVDMKSGLNNLKVRYNMNRMEANSDLRNLSSIVNCIRTKNTSLLSAIRSAEDSLQELKNKLRQTETILYERKKIRENSFFKNIN